MSRHRDALLIAPSPSPTRRGRCSTTTRPAIPRTWPASEGYAHAFAKAYGLRTIAIRFANVYGPWSVRKQGAMNKFFQAIHTGEPMVIYGDGTSSRDYIHVDDNSRALRLALEHPDVPGGTVLHAASGVETTVQELAELCRTAAGVPGHPIEYRPARPGEDRNFATYNLAHKVLGYSPTIGREDGIRRTWDWFATEVFGKA